MLHQRRSDIPRAALNEAEYTGMHATCRNCGVDCLGHDLAFETQRNLARRQQPFVDLAVNPLHSFCTAISVGIVGGTPVLDLPYVEDSAAEVDMNVVMLRPILGGESKFVEVGKTVIVLPTCTRSTRLG